MKRQVVGKTFVIFVSLENFYKFLLVTLHYHFSHDIAILDDIKFGKKLQVCYKISSTKNLHNNLHLVYNCTFKKNSIEINLEKKEESFTLFEIEKRNNNKKKGRIECKKENLRSIKRSSYQ